MCPSVACQKNQAYVPDHKRGFAGLSKVIPRLGLHGNECTIALILALTERHDATAADRGGGTYPDHANSALIPATLTHQLVGSVYSAWVLPKELR